MKTVRGLAAIAVMFAAGVAPIAPASAGQTSNKGANAELHQFCDDLITSGLYPALSLGECMSFNRTSEAGFKAHFCDSLLETDTLDEWDFTSYSDCIRNLPF